MINIDLQNDFHIPKLCYELYEYDSKILEHSKKLDENQVMIWIPLSLNIQFIENGFPNVLYIVYTDIEIENDNKMVCNSSFKDNIMNMLKFIRTKNEFQKFYITSYLTYIENGDNNKINFLNSMNNKLNISYRYINENEYILQNHDLLHRFEHMPLIKTNALYIIDKNDTNHELYSDLINLVIYEKSVYKKFKDSYHCKYYCSIHELKNIITEKYSFSYNLSSYILNYISLISHPIDPFVFEFKNFYLDYMNNVVYLKNDDDLIFFKDKKIKIIYDINVNNFNYFESFTTLHFVKSFLTSEIVKLICDIFEYLYHNKKIIFTGDIVLYNFIKRFLCRIFKNYNLIFIEDHDNIFYKKSNFEKSFSILFKENIEIYDINLNIPNFKKTNLNLDKSLTLLLASFLNKNE